MKKTAKILDKNSLTVKFTAFFIMVVIVFSSSYSPAFATNNDEYDHSDTESSVIEESNLNSLDTTTHNDEDDSKKGEDYGHKKKKGGHDNHDWNNDDEENSPESQPLPVTIVATKIVCNSETDLPNWGLGGPDVTSSTAIDFIANHSNCHLEPNWKFQWSFDNETGKLPAPVLSGDFVGEAVTSIGYTSWNTFGVTDVNGVSTTTISELSGANKIWVREVLQDGYIGFNYPQNGNNNISAEIYCHKDVLNYDNYDFIGSVTLGGTYYCVAFNSQKVSTPPPAVNQAPVISLVGQNPVTITVGDAYADAGATALDLEDGVITSKIVTTGSVDISVAGSYVVTYNVKDSLGLSAVPVTRVVNVVLPTPTKRGKITFCLILADQQNNIATTSVGLPQGTFSISLSTSTETFSTTTTLASKTWNSETFSPNKKVILNTNDADCMTYDNLDYGIYNYSTLSVNGSTWNGVSYNDQDTQPVNNVFDFFPFGDTNTNSDGYIIIDENRYERTLVTYSKYKNVPACYLPEITSSLAVGVTVNQTFSYSLTASSTLPVTWAVGTTTLPSGLSFSTTTDTNIISGTPSVVGSYNVDIKAVNDCGFDTKTLVISVASVGGGGGSTPASNLSVVKVSDKPTANVSDTVVYTITVKNDGPSTANNVKVVDTIPNTLDFVSASSTVGLYATSTSIWTIGDLLNGSSTSLTLEVKVKSGTEGQKISNTAVVSGDLSDPDTTNNTSVSDININVPTPPPSTGGGGGGGNGGGGGANGPIVGSFVGANGPIVQNTAPVNPSVEIPANSSCYYLYDYLRKDFNNNPVEVKKLQVFLRDLEGFTTVQITGVYDDQTIVALNTFQERYKGDILTPWGHTEATSYTYILTKKKVNEIYCKTAFPVTPLQQVEIDNYKTFLQSLKDSGVLILDENEVKPGTGTSTSVGFGSSIKDSIQAGLSTLAGFSSTTKGIASDFTANVISSGKKVANLVMAFLMWPLSKIKGDSVDQCTAYIWSNWLNIILILVIIVISYLWYREYRNNKKLEDINKEIDLK